MPQARDLTTDYTAKTWRAGDKLLASDMTAISDTLNEVEEAVKVIEQTKIPALQASIDSVGDLGTVVDVPDGQTVVSYVDNQIANLVGTAPETLDTIAEVAAALQQNEGVVDSLNAIVTENRTKIDEANATIVQVQQQVASKVDSAALDEKLGTKADVGHTHTIDQVTDLQTKLDEKQPAGDYPVYQKFVAGADPSERRTIQLANHDSISGVDNTGAGAANLIMMSKWNKVDIGSANYTTNLNSLDGTVQINDDKVVATVDQIPDVSEFVTSTIVDEKIATKADKSEIPSVEGLVSETFVLDQVATKADKIHVHNIEDVTGLQDALDGKQPVGDYATVDQLPDIDPLATTEYVDSAIEQVNSAIELKADKDELTRFVRIDVRDSKLTTTVHSKETILGWFGCQDEVELKQIINKQIPMVEMYSVIYSGLPHTYKMNIDYAAFESANQIKLVFVGLNTRDDSPVRYTIVANLDGTLIGDSESNVSMLLEPLTDTSGFVTSEQLETKADKVHTHVISDVDGLQSALDGKQSVGDYATKQHVTDELAKYDTEIKSEIDNRLAAVYRYKGSVENYDALPTEGQTVGDVYNVTDTGDNYCWTEQGWDKLAGTVDLSNYATTEALTTGLAGKANIDHTHTTEEITDFDEKIQAVVATIPTEEQLEQFATKSELAGKADKVHTHEIDDVNGLSDALAGKADTSAIPDVSGFALKSEVPSIEGLAKATDVTQEIETAVSDKATTEALTQGLAEKANVEHTHEVADIEDLQSALDSKTITVGYVGLNEDSVEIKQGQSVVAKLTVPYYPLKVNASLFIDDGSFYDPEGGLGGHPDYFDNVKWSGGDKLTEEQLAKGPFLLITGMNTTDQESIKIVTNLVSLGKDSALGKVYATKEELETKADVDHSHYTLPISANIPLVTLQDKVYTESEICEWFGASDVTELKGLFGEPHQFVIRYNISSGSLGYHSYQIPFQYLYITANNNTFKGVAVGLNPNNDTVSKIVIDANFDGTIIEGNSNVKVTYTSLE